MTATPKPRAGEHTKGPWRLHANFADTVSAGPLGEKSAVARCEPNGQAQDNARRIVACVNACEGIKTENLEHASLDFGKELRADLDEALDALTLLDQAENGPWDGEEQKRHLRTAWSFARDALAKHGR